MILRRSPRKSLSSANKPFAPLYSSSESPSRQPLVMVTLQEQSSTTRKNTQSRLNWTQEKTHILQQIQRGTSSSWMGCLPRMQHLLAQSSQRRMCKRGRRIRKATDAFALFLRMSRRLQKMSRGMNSRHERDGTLMSEPRLKKARKRRHVCDLA